MDLTGVDMDGFVLGKPELVCRWRLAGGKLPLENRHLRALSRRMVGGERLSRELLGWAKQHIEWTLAPGSVAHPDGVLMLIVDEAHQAAMTVGAYEPLRRTSCAWLVKRAEESLREAEATGVAPESLWAVTDDCLVMGLGGEATPSGAADLVLQLADTLGISQPNATYKVNNLVAKGYVTKTVSEGDKREIRLSVCDRFYKYYGDLDHFADRAVAALEAEYSPEEIHTFQKMLRSLAEHVK